MSHLCKSVCLGNPDVPFNVYYTLDVTPTTLFVLIRKYILICLIRKAIMHRPIHAFRIKTEISKSFKSDRFFCCLPPSFKFR